MLEFLNYWDTQLFLKINGLHNSFFDTLMFWISSRIIWLPLYGFIIYQFFKFYKKKAFLVLLIALFLFIASDQLSVLLFKNIFLRLRPCHNNELSNLIHLVNGHCGGMYGFVSSHATNSFALLAFTHFLLIKYQKILVFAMYFWAFLVIYSRVYLGVHYPTDVIVGAIFGFLLGFGFAQMTIYLLKKMEVNH